MSVYNLDWFGSYFSYEGMVSLETIGYGSCFFHGIVGAYFIPYQRKVLNGRPLNRRKFIENFRKDLARRLARPIDPEDSSSPIYYDVLSRGNLKEFSREVPKYSLKNMQKHLVTNRYVDNVYVEFMSEVLNKDIYLLDYEAKDVYIFGNDMDLLYKNRDSIVLIVRHNIEHYELVGIRDDDGKIVTLFDSNHSFILSIRKRYQSKVNG